MNVAWSSWLIVDRGLFRQSWWKLSARVASPRQSTRLQPGQTVAALTDLVEALVLTECGAAARVNIDGVTSRHALRPLQVPAGARHRRPGQIVRTAVVLASRGAGCGEANRRARARPVVIVVRHLDAVESVVALEADGDGRPRRRGVCVHILVLDLDPAIGEESDLECRRLANAVRGSVPLRQRTSSELRSRERPCGSLQSPQTGESGQAPNSKCSSLLKPECALTCGPQSVSELHSPSPAPWQ